MRPNQFFSALLNSGVVVVITLPCLLLGSCTLRVASAIAFA